MNDTGAEHSQDSDCNVNPETDCCTVCGVMHGAACTVCGQKAYHRPDCNELDRPEGAQW
jgi:hypothetical protein